jgi:hypothetical protein
MNKHKTELDDYDFGFTAVDEKEVADKFKPEKDWEAVANNIYDMILPFLNNLKKNPDKAYIHWPNRVEKINEFSDKLKSQLK